MSFLQVICVLLVAGSIERCESRSQIARTKYYFFYGPTYYDHKIYNYNELYEITQHDNYDENRTTVFYIHGYNESPESDSVRLIVDAYNERDEHNLIVLDWSDAASGDYFSNAVPNAVSLGNTFATVLLAAFKRGMDIEKFHIVCHSLGAQMAGFIGRKLIIKSNHAQKLRRITGLDPANPPFFPDILLEHLDHNDAEFVDIIHTDAGLYGQPIATGTVDFWPNEGTTLQPGCPFRLSIPLSENDLCSHQRSWQYYAESVSSKNKNTFLAVSARNWSRFRASDTNSTNVINMGLRCPLGAHGDYFLQTNGEKPYSRGINGIRYLN